MTNNSSLPVLDVVVGDAFDLDVGLLVLKHAQAPFGVDEAAEARLGINLEGELPPGRHLIVPGGPLGARSVLFLGVPTLDRFGYAEINEFARTALEVADAEVPEIDQIALTLHGAGYGLDEIACAEAELGGLLRGLGVAREVGRGLDNLERITIVERDRGRAERIKHRFDQLLTRLPSGGFDLGFDHRELVERLMARSAGAPANRDHAFVAMPFDPDFDDLYHYGLSAAIRSSGLLSERIDQAVFTGSVVEKVKEKIATATILVAVLTGDNPNVFLEVGYGWGCGKPTVLLRKDGSELRFDVQSEKCISYTSIKDCEEKLATELRGLIS